MTIDLKKYPYPSEGGAYSELKVLKSHAGWYIGRMFWNEDGGFEEPGSRESGYIDSKEEAERELRTGFETRSCIENDAAYASGTLPHPTHGTESPDPGDPELDLGDIDHE